MNCFYEIDYKRSIKEGKIITMEDYMNFDIKEYIHASVTTHKNVDNVDKNVD